MYGKDIFVRKPKAICFSFIHFFFFSSFCYSIFIQNAQLVEHTIFYPGAIVNTRVFSLISLLLLFFYFSVFCSVINLV